MIGGVGMGGGVSSQLGSAREGKWVAPFLIAMFAMSARAASVFSYVTAKLREREGARCGRCWSVLP